MPEPFHEKQKQHNKHRTSEAIYNDRSSGKAAFRHQTDTQHPVKTEKVVTENSLSVAAFSVFI